MKQIAEAWTSFEKSAVPAAATQSQRDDMKIAFYGGACIIFARLVNDQGIPFAVFAQRMEALREEVKEWIGEVENSAPQKDGPH